MKKISVETKKKKEVVDITDRLNELISENRIQKGVVHLVLQHTTAAITTADLDPGMEKDIPAAFDKIIPNVGFKQHHNPSHAPDHLISTLIGATLSLIVENGKLVLGTWQRVVLLEFDGPRSREIVIQW